MLSLAVRTQQFGYKEGFFDCEAARPGKAGTEENRAASSLRMTPFAWRTDEEKNRVGTRFRPPRRTSARQAEWLDSLW